MYEMTIALNELVIDYPLGIDDRKDGGRVNGKFLLGSDVEVGTVSLDLSHVREIACQNTSEYGLMLIN
jgi:hypothetical protein